MEKELLIKQALFGTPEYTGESVLCDAFSAVAPEQVFTERVQSEKADRFNYVFRGFKHENEELLLQMARALASNLEEFLFVPGKRAFDNVKIYAVNTIVIDVKSNHNVVFKTSDGKVENSVSFHVVPQDYAIQINSIILRKFKAEGELTTDPNSGAFKLNLATGEQVNLGLPAGLGLYVPLGYSPFCYREVV